MDFLTKFGFSIIPSKQQVLHAASGHTFSKASTTSFISPWNPETVANVTVLPPQVQQLREEFPSLLRPSTALPNLSTVLCITSTQVAPPLCSLAPRGLDPDKHCIAEEEFLAMKKADIFRCSNSPWVSPLHLVPKKVGSWRPCGNYRRLNAITIPNRYPLPNMQSLNERMAGCTVFSQIDLVKAYH
jgi:hypothetical protein